MPQVMLCDGEKKPVTDVVAVDCTGAAVGLTGALVEGPEPAIAGAGVNDDPAAGVTARGLAPPQAPSTSTHPTAAVPVASRETRARWTMATLDSPERPAEQCAR